MDKTVFERLVSGMGMEEKQEFIKKLRSVPHSEDNAPLKEPRIKDSKPVSWQKCYQSLHPLKQFWLMLVSIFSGQTLPDLVKKNQVKELGIRINKVAPSIFDTRTRELRSDFYLVFRDLWEGLDFFRDPLQKALGGDRKAFYSFLLGFRQESFHNKLLEELNFKTLGEKEPTKTPRDLKQILDNRLKELFTSLTPEEKKPVYEDVKALLSLSNLLPIQGEKILQSFIEVRSDGVPDRGGIDQIRIAITDLWERLDAFVIPPGLSALKALFIYSMEDQGINEDQWEENLNQILTQAQTYLGAIRLFNRTVPLELILQFVTGQMDLSAQSFGGGEDWLTQVRKFWEKRLDQDFKAYDAWKTLQTLNSDICSFLGITMEIWSSHCPKAPYYPDEIPLKGARVIGFLELFWLREFESSFHPLFVLILEEGTFAKKVNRTALSDCLTALKDLPLKWRELEVGFMPEGTWGELLTGLPAMKNDGDRRDKIVQVVEMAGYWFDDFQFNTHSLLMLTLNLLHGIQTPSVSALENREYDTLTNLGQLKAKHPFLHQKLESLTFRWDRMTRFFKALSDMESRT